MFDVVCCCLSNVFVACSCFVVCSLRIDVRCSVCAVRRVLFVDRCLLFVVVRCVVFVVCFLPLFLSFGACCSLFVVGWSLFVVRCFGSSFVVCCL